ncbi:MAG: exodeoxyribonuclease III [Gammaproteobacteria bacterium]|jgi:exodeoxyribonuclease-3|nr:exodeoxyribonuclease III [Gammaproteobacteria bacterium]
MRIISLNLNGIRSATTKGAFRWLSLQNADVICLQEVRADEELLKQEAYQLSGYHCYHTWAQKKGYSGVSIYTKQEPTKVVRQLGFDLADQEGRYIHVEFDNIVIASIYMPSGTSGDARQKLKYEFLDKYFLILDKNLQSKQSYVICGDWNIAHKNIDLKNWKTNQKNSGFLPEERAWLESVFAKGWVDAFRVLNQEPEQYTWWSHRANARANNVGWRIDYQVVTPDLKDKIKSVAIYNEEIFSDHAPLIVDYEIPIPF